MYGVIATGVISLINNIYYKKQNPINEIMQKTMGFLSFLCIMLGYFFITNTFLYFINFCFGGLLEFGSENLNFSIPLRYIFVIVLALIALLKAFNKKDKDNKLFIIIIYLLCLSFLIYPLANTYHSILGTIMIFPLVIRLMNKKIEDKNRYHLYMVIGMCIMVIEKTTIEVKKTLTEDFFAQTNNLDIMLAEIGLFIIFILFTIYIISENKKLCKYGTITTLCITLALTIALYASNVSQVGELPESMKIFANQGISREKINYIEQVTNYILNKEAEGYKVYVVSQDASYYMAPLGKNNYMYDLALYGSLGFDGEQALIEETKKLENEIILKDKELMHQEPKGFDEFIKNNYIPVDQIGNLIVYQEK